MASDLESALVDGGVTPAAAKLIANAIDNAATGRLSIGQQLSDATPQRAMRMVDADTRRYTLRNLDYSHEPGMAARLSRQPVSGVGPDHPYRGSQPASPSPTLATQSVSAGKYVNVASKTTDEVAQSEVALNVSHRGGQHARLNQATGQIESVPISVEITPKELLEATVEESASGTVIRIHIRDKLANGEFLNISNVFPLTIEDSVGGTCTIKKDGQAVTAYSWTG